jgi:undecaprenyl-diphosphatase
LPEAEPVLRITTGRAPSPELLAKAIAIAEAWATNHVVRRDLERQALSRLWSLRQLSCCAFTMISGNWDRELLLTLNSLVGRDGLYLLWDLANNSLFTRSPIFFVLVALWFSDDCRKRRSRMLAGLLAVCLATVLSVWLQFHLAPHIRPLVDPALHLKIFDSTWSLINWNRKGSFCQRRRHTVFRPATVIFLETRLVGLICFCWVAAMIAVPKVVWGFHYPSDAGSLVLGPTVVLSLQQDSLSAVANRIAGLRQLFGAV